MGAKQSHYERSQLLGVEDGHLFWNFFYTLSQKPPGFWPRGTFWNPGLSRASRRTTALFPLHDELYVDCGALAWNMVVDWDVIHPHVRGGEWEDGIVMRRKIVVDRRSSRWSSSRNKLSNSISIREIVINTQGSTTGSLRTLPRIRRWNRYLF